MGLPRADVDTKLDQPLYDTARLINAAIAKIQTIDCTPGIIGHPTTVFAMRANWLGLLGERSERRFGRITSNDVLRGIPGSPTDHHGVPYSLTEEFAAVYRMHPLIPDAFEFRALGDDRKLVTWTLPDLVIYRVRLAGAEVARRARCRGNPGRRGNLDSPLGSLHPGAVARCAGTVSCSTTGRSAERVAAERIGRAVPASSAGHVLIPLSFATSARNPGSKTLASHAHS